MDLPTVPGAGAARARRTSFVAAPPPNRAPDYRVPSGRERSGSTGTSAPPARRTTSGWSHQGQELHVVDTAFSEAHRELSRLSRQRAASASSAQRRGRDDGGKDDNEADDDDDEDQPDPNKVVWDGDDDAGNPQNWSTRKKWTVTVLCAQATLVVTFASSAPSSAVRQIAATYGVSNVAASLTTSLFLAGYCAGPLIWAPLSELVGRRPVFVGSLLVFALFQIGDALAQNFATIIVIRFIAAVFASSPLTNAGGVIADIWDPINRGKAMSLFSASVFLGPVIGPIVGGYTVDSYLSFKWIFAFIGFWGAASWVLIALFLPETYHPILLKKRAKRMRKEDPEKHGDKYAELERADFSLKSIAQRTLLRPIIMLFVEPIVLAVTIYLSVVYSVLYATFSIFPIIWGQLRGLSNGEVGLIFIGVGIGTTLGALISVYTQKHYRVLVPKWHGHPPPEERLWGGMLAGPLLIIGIFWLGWTGNYPSIHWAVPAGSLIFLGMAFTLIFVSFLTYLVEVYLMFSASALAANTLLRSAAAASFPLFVNQWFSAMGVNWACSLIGFVALVIAPAPFFFYKFGWKLRQKSRFAPCLDVGMRDRVKREEEERKAATRGEGDVGGEKAHERV
ncbi:major facilitator superfamily domain-containing protein [Rhodotorula diobovata]|uniref:Major facilitator superfamily domain-containing protein n=1 Tax=Rhodotorula diobovata TaxID=5288 RepID=A0A5C5FSU5_9BASI|nr:major facilitator superfamily domain-containing protein [Rhodotorula diobovata]